MTVNIIWQYEGGSAIPGDAQDLGHVSAGSVSDPLVMLGFFETDIAVSILTEVGFFINPYDGIYTGDYDAQKDYIDLLSFGNIHQNVTGNRGFLINQKSYELPEFPDEVDITGESVPVGETTFTLEAVFPASGQNIVGSTVTFSDAVVFATEQDYDDGSTELTGAGDYSINYITGDVYTFSTTNGGTVDYTVTGWTSCHAGLGSTADSAITLLKTAVDPEADDDGELLIGSVMKIKVMISLPSLLRELGLRQISMYLTFSYTI